MQKRIAKRTLMNITDDEQAIVDHLNMDRAIVVKLAGTTFPCLATGEARQDIIERLANSTGWERNVTLEKQVDNEYDKDAICVRIGTGEDIGFIPRKGFVVLEVPKGGRIYHQPTNSDRVNKVLRPFDLKAEILEITGGFNSTASYGVTLIIQKNTDLS